MGMRLGGVRLGDGSQRATSHTPLLSLCTAGRRKSQHIHLCDRAVVSGLDERGRHVLNRLGPFDGALRSRHLKARREVEPLSREMGPVGVANHDEVALTHSPAELGFRVSPERRATARRRRGAAPFRRARTRAPCASRGRRSRSRRPRGRGSREPKPEREPHHPGAGQREKSRLEEGRGPMGARVNISHEVGVEPPHASTILGAPSCSVANRVVVFVTSVVRPSGTAVARTAKGLLRYHIPGGLRCDRPLHLAPRLPLARSRVYRLSDSPHDGPPFLIV